MKRTKQPPELTQALREADNGPGWNSRPRVVQVFEVGKCTVFVVPFICFAYRRRDKAAAAWRASQAEAM